MSIETISTPSELDPKYETHGSPIPEWIVNEALIINEAMGRVAVTVESAQAGRGKKGAIFENAEILEVMKSLVNPCYFVEYPVENLGGRDRGEMLLELFKSEFTTKDGTKYELGEYLGKTHQGISLAMSTLDDSTAEAVKYLNEKNVPVTAWVVVEDVEGYWTNQESIPETVVKAGDIVFWSKEHNIHLNAVGFDSEMPLQLLASLSQKNIVQTARELIKYKNNSARKPDGLTPQAQFDGLVKKLQDEGMETEIYTFTQGIVRGMLGGIGVDSPDNKRTIEMVYTNGLPFQELAFKLMSTPNTIPAFGIVSGKDDETPGRDFEAIVKAMETGAELKDMPKGAIPKHLSGKDLEVLINAWLNREINIDNREFKIRDLYLFAMNDARVAAMLVDSLDAAFEKQKQKAEK